MGLFEKSKEKEIQRLRSAGLSVAHANRAAQSRRGGGAVLTLVGGAGVMLVGAIAVLALQMDATPPASQAAPSAQVKAMDNLVTPPPPASIGVSDQATAQREEELTAAIKTAVAKEAAERAAQAVIAQIPPATTAQQVEPTPATLQVEDCVTKLDSYLAPLFVQFDLGSTLITPENAQLLARISDRIITCEDAYVMVAGHADSSGDDSTNITLSWERADRTLNRLVELGVNPNAVEAVGFGARAPLSQGSVAEDGADRRVDFRVLRLREDQS